MSKQAIMIVGAVAALGVAGYLIYGQIGTQTTPSEFLDSQEQAWICTACGHTAEMSLEDSRRPENLSADGFVKCPACSKDVFVQALKCPKCNELVANAGHGQLPDVCPKCKQRTKK